MGLRRELTRQRRSPGIDVGIGVSSLLFAIGSLAVLPPVLAVLGVGVAVLVLAWAAWDARVRP